jgi:hypothetical protein
MYGVRGIPTNFLIGLDGNVIFADYVMPDEKIIEENLPKSPTPKPKKSKTDRESGNWLIKKVVSSDRVL